MAAARATRQGLQLLSGRSGLWAAQQSSGFTSLTLGSWWQGTASPAAASAAPLGWQRVTALLPSLPATLEDAQLLAAPKKKVRWGHLPASNNAAPSWEQPLSHGPAPLACLPACAAAAR